jgi:ATP-binding cassette subfamily C exporter for protease/lipase
MIQQFTDGYNTKLGEGGQSLSGGQRQRIGLARAVYGLPSLIVLDEPNANLDSLGEQALLGAIEYLKKQNKTLIIITHKTNVLVAVDYVLVMNSGKVQNYGPTAQILDVLSGNQKTNIANKSNNLIRTVPAA